MTLPCQIPQKTEQKQPAEYSGVKEIWQHPIFWTFPVLSGM
jgi:hypothetical protein